MNILILINSGPGYINFLNKLGVEMKKSGHTIIYACESYYPEYKENIWLKNEKVYYFHKHLEKVDDNNLSFYENINLRKTYFPCFDRNQSYKVNIETGKKMDDTILRLINFYEKIFKNENIDGVIYENISNSFSYISYLVAKRFSKKYYGLITSRMPGRYEIWNDPFGDIEKRAEYFNKIQIKNIPDGELGFIKTYIDNINRIKPDYMKNNPTSMNAKYINYYRKKAHIINGIFNYIVNYHGSESLEVGNPLTYHVNIFKRNIKRKFKIKSIKRLFDVVNYNDNYYIFPMHYQPESSTSVNAMYNINQYETIKNIAFSLPIGFYLYVKEHPNGIGFQNYSFYKKLKQLPNVKYINPAEDNSKLIKAAKGVITLTSTMGYEALLMQKPVITLGNVFYNYHPYCSYVKDFEELYQVIQKQKEIVFDKFEDFNNRFVYVYMKTTYEGRVFGLANNEDIIKIKDDILKELFNDKVKSCYVP